MPDKAVKFECTAILYLPQCLLPRKAQPVYKISRTKSLRLEGRYLNGYTVTTTSNNDLKYANLHPYGSSVFIFVDFAVEFLSPMGFNFPPLFQAF